MKNFKEFDLDEARMSAAEKLSKAWDRQRAKSDASERRTPSSIPKKEEPKKQGVAESFKESAICAACDSDPCICDESHGFVSEAIDKEHPIVKEYDSLKKNHDIKSLRGLIKGQHRIVDTSEYKTKDHAISAYLRTKHGDKKVDQAFGFNKEEFELDEVDQLNSRHQVVLNRTPAGKEREIQRNREHLKSQMKTTKSMGGLAGPKGKLPEEVELDEASNDYFARRKREEDIISGKKPARKKAPAQTSDYQNRRNKEKMKEEAELDEAAQGHTIEAHGIRGMKGTPWRKTFKSHEHLSDWADKNDSVEVHATRELDGVKKKTNEDLSESSSKHRVGVTVSEPDHPMVTKRKETQQKFVKVSAASKEDAVAKAKKFYSKQGYRVHSAEHHSMVNEALAGNLTCTSCGEVPCQCNTLTPMVETGKRLKKTFKQFAK